MQKRAKELDTKLERFYFKVYANAGLAAIGIALSIWSIPHGGAFFHFDIPQALAAMGIFGVIKSN